MTPFNFNMYKELLNTLPGDFFLLSSPEFFYVLLSANTIPVFFSLIWMFCVGLVLLEPTIITTAV